MKTYYITTIGCQMNKSDSERIAAYLEKLGYIPAKLRKDADLIVLTTCGVRQSAEDRVYGLLPRFKKDNPGAKVIFTGCLVGREDVKKRVQDNVDIWLPITKLNTLADSLGAEYSGTTGSLNYLNFSAKHQSGVGAYVPIGNGCDNFCTYCVVPYARGREVYRPAKDIITEVRDLIGKGYKEITLIAQNVNSYYSPQFGNKKARQINFAQLLKQVNDISGNFWLRFATSHPKDMSRELIETIAVNSKICKHIHLPIQAGDNEVLKAMNRKYTRREYLDLILAIKKQIPGVAISTDIIVGFPGETNSQFNKTVDVFNQVKFDQAYIARYSPRPGTAAAKLTDNVSATEKKKREKILTELLKKHSRQYNKKLINKILTVLIVAKNKKNEFIARTETNKTVIIPFTSQYKTGEFVKVKIISAQDFGLTAEFV